MKLKIIYLKTVTKHKRPSISKTDYKRKILETNSDKFSKTDKSFGDHGKKMGISKGNLFISIFFELYLKKISFNTICYFKRIF